MICLMFKFGFSLEQVWNSIRNKNGSFINFTHNEKKKKYFQTVFDFVY